MKKLIAVFIAGVVLGSTGIALGQSYWKQTGATYRCEGTRTGVICRETNWRPPYRVDIIPGQVTVNYGPRVIFGCDRKKSPARNCAYFGP